MREREREGEREREIVRERERERESAGKGIGVVSENPALDQKTSLSLNQFQVQAETFFCGIKLVDDEENLSWKKRCLTSLRSEKKRKLSA